MALELDKPTISYPDGHAQNVVLTAADAAQTVTVNNRLCIIDGFTNAGSANRTINLALDFVPTNGAEILVLTNTAGTETTTFGTSMKGAVITGTAGKTKAKRFMYNETLAAYVATGAVEQID